MILHVDMDAFYASVEQRDQPGLQGKPVVVGGSATGRGVVCAANYEARKFGIHSAMPAAQARQRCPAAIFLPPRMEYYAEVSREIREIFRRFTPVVEPISLDEAFLDVTASERLFGSSQQIGRQIKQQIRDQLRLVASVGVAPNKFLAKLASDLEKPDGLVVVDPDRVQDFLDPLPVGRLWGVGRVAGENLRRLGVQTIADLRRLPAEALGRQFGQQGRHLWQLARGMDPRPVVADRQAKSVSHETTFAEDIGSLEQLRAWAVELTEQVARRLRRHRRRGRSVQVKIRFTDFRTITRASTLSEPTNVTQQLWHAVDQILLTRMPPRHPPVRLLGVGVSHFDPSHQKQGWLFEQGPTAAQERLDEATDQIRDKFGTSSLNRACRMLHNARHKPQPRPGD